MSIEGERFDEPPTELRAAAGEAAADALSVQPSSPAANGPSQHAARPPLDRKSVLVAGAAKHVGTFNVSERVQANYRGDEQWHAGVVDRVRVSVAGRVAYSIQCARGRARRARQHA